jgi:hypothetical protein
MPNYKEINWDLIRAEYVMSVEYPSIDDLVSKHNVSKPLMIQKSNDRSDPINNGKTWQEQRKDFIDKKRNSEENQAIAESKKMIKGVVNELNNISLKAFKLVSRDLDELLRLQEEAIDKKEPFNIQRYVRLGDVAKIAESLHKLTGSQGAKEMVLRLEVGNKQKSLADLSDEELKRLDYQVQTGQSEIIDVESEVIDA